MSKNSKVRSKQYFYKFDYNYLIITPKVMVLKTWSFRQKFNYFFLDLKKMFNAKFVYVWARHGTLKLMGITCFFFYEFIFSQTLIIINDLTYNPSSLSWPMVTVLN